MFITTTNIITNCHKLLKISELKLKSYIKICNLLARRVLLLYNYANLSNRNDFKRVGT